MHFVFPSFCATGHWVQETLGLDFWKQCGFYACLGIGGHVGSCWCSERMVGLQASS